MGQRETLSDGHVDTLQVCSHDQISALSRALPLTLQWLVCMQTQGNLASLLHELGDGEGALALLDDCVPLMLDKLGHTSPIAGYFQHVRDEIFEQLTG